MSDKDCRGTLHKIKLAANLYESSSWYHEGNKNAKAQSIESLMERLGVDKTKLCDGGCGDKEEDKGKKCRPVSLKGNAEDEGGEKEENKPIKADLSIAEMEIFEKTYKKYVLWVKKDCTVLLKINCDCLGPNE